MRALRDRHDAVAVAEAIGPGTLKCRRLTADVVCDSATARGATIIDTRSGSEDARTGREIDVALAADIDALRDFLLDELSSGRSQSRQLPAPSFPSLRSRRLNSPQPPPQR